MMLKNHMKGMPSDYHVHTVLCKHAEGDISAYVDKACQMALPEIGFSDHAPAPDGYDIDNRMALDRFPDYERMVSSVCGRGCSSVVFGVEADYYEGGLEFLRTWLPAQSFDFVLGSVHYLGSWGFDNPAERAVWASIDVTQAWKAYFNLIARLADSGLFDVVAHLDLPKKFNYRPSDKAIKEMVQSTLDRIAKAGMGIELNTSGLRRPVKEIYPSPLILELAHERDIPICFGSDAHAPQDVGHEFDRAIALAKEAGYTDYLQFRQRTKSRIPLPK